MTRQWCIRALLAMAVCVAFAFLGATYGEAAAPAHPVWSLPLGRLAERA